jgi:hypothetical protein
MFRIMTDTRVLYISGSIGLGHARRDLAIARELRRLDPGVEIAWLAGDPARQVITEAGETPLPESAAYGEETAVAEDTAQGFALNLLGRFALRAQSAWKQAVATFEEVSTKYPYDLLIGDETYEIDAALEKQPELKKTPFVMIYDFVGLDAMSRNPLERLIVYRETGSGVVALAASHPGRPVALHRGARGRPRQAFRFPASQPPRVRAPPLPLRRIRFSLRSCRLLGQEGGACGPRLRR